MKKHTYQSINVQQVKVPALLAKLSTARVLVGIDIAKTKMMAVFGTEAGEPVLRVGFEHPRQSRDFIAVLQALAAEGKRVDVASEPTGTYGDALNYQMHLAGLALYRVSPKKTHDAAELFDGVPSQHDGKDATLVMKLHSQNLSKPWAPSPEERRELQAQVKRRELVAQMQERLYGQMEALLARHWPELQEQLPLRKRTTALTMLVAFPTAQQVQEQAAAVLELLRKHSRGRVTAQLGAQVVESAYQTLGVPATPGEAALLGELARQILQLGQQLTEVDKQLRQMMLERPAEQGLVEMVGATTSAVLCATLGDLRSYASVGALEKACGLNLKESSSGNFKSPLHITKRGPGVVRKYLYLATLRWLQWDLVARAWYQKRAGYLPDSKQRAVVALMRKLVAALWHLARQTPYDAHRLFDVSRLELPKGEPGEMPLEQSIESLTSASESLVSESEQEGAVTLGAAPECSSTGVKVPRAQTPPTRPRRLVPEGARRPGGCKSGATGARATTPQASTLGVS